MPIKVNMFKLRWVTDCQPRTSKGQPHQSTTGVAKQSSIHPQILIGASILSGSLGMRSLIPIISRGIVRTTLTQKRRVMSVSSRFSSSSSETVRGSRDIPQIGQFPGLSRTISGCIGQVYSFFLVGISILLCGAFELFMETGSIANGVLL